MIPLFSRLDSAHRQPSPSTFVKMNVIGFPELQPPIPITSVTICETSGVIRFACASVELSGLQVTEAAVVGREEMSRGVSLMTPELTLASPWMATVMGVSDSPG